MISEADRWPAVLLVVPTLNEEAALGTVLRALCSDLPPTLPCTVVVADGGSTDHTRAVFEAARASFPHVAMHWLHNPARLQSAGINLAVEQYGGAADILVRCDAHAGYPPGFVAGLVRTLTEREADAVVVPMDSVGSSGVQLAVAQVSDSLVGSGGSAHRGGRTSGWVDHGHHAAMRLESFRRAGGYDPGMSHNEDAELDCRQRAGGSRIWLESSLRLAYSPRNTLKALARQYFQYGRGRSRTQRRHPGSWRMRQLAVPLFMGICLLCVLLAPFWPLLLLCPAAYLAALVANAAHLALRHRTPDSWLAAPAALVMHSAWAAGWAVGMVTLRERPWSPPVPSHQRLSVVQLDPSLFTAPYDAALHRGLAGAGVDARWAVRPLRGGDRPELPSEVSDDFFYRRSDSDALPGPLRALFKGFGHIAGLITLAQRLRQHQPDLLHVQWAVLPLVDALFMRWVARSRPVVMTVHDTVPFNGERVSFLQNLSFDAPLRAADHLIVHTRAARARLLERGIAADRITVVPHGPLPLEATPQPGRPRDLRHCMVLFGEIKPYKGLDLLVEALGRLAPAARSGLRVVVAGRPRMDLAPIMLRIKALDLDTVIEIRPERQSAQQMADLFDDADSFVFPYRQIDASGVYFLVKGLGRWMVASEVGIFAEDMVPGKDGRLVAAGDTAALAVALEEAVGRGLHPRNQSQREMAGEAGADAWIAIGQATRRVYLQALRHDTGQPHTPWQKAQPS